MNSQTYLENSENWGNYQYIFLEDVINDFMMSRDTDDYTSVAHRYQIIYQAKRGIRELYYDVAREIKAIELDLSPTLNIIVPSDFVNYVRISWVDENRILHPMVIDGSLSIADVYLQDHNYNILFDNNGCILKDHSSTGDITSVNNNNNVKSFSFCNSGFNPNKDFSKEFPNGKFAFDRSSGVIQFSPDVEGKSIVLEYISDGLYQGCDGTDDSKIKIHKFCEAALLDFIYYNLIKNRRNIPANEKMRARKEYYNSRRIAKRRLKNIKQEELLQVAKGTNKWNYY